MTNFNNTYFKSIILIVSSILIFFSVFFYLERVICLDGPIYLLNMVNYEKIDIPTNRFIAVFTQVLPLLFIKLKLSLKLIAISYSLNFMMFHIILVLIMLYKFKDYLSALLLLFAHVLSGNINFYFPISEYQMGLSFLIFFVSYFLYLANKNQGSFTIKQKFILLIILTTIIYAHPLMIVSSIFYILFLTIEYKTILKKYFFLMLLIIALITFVKWFISTVGYDIENVSKTENYTKFFPNFWEAKSYKLFIQHTISYNYFYFLSIVVFLYYILKKEFQKSILFLSFLIGYIFIVMIVNYNEPTYNHYTEHLYQAIAYFIAIPLFYDVFKNINSKIIILFLIVFFSIKLNTIFHFSDYNGYRIAWIKKQFRKNSNNKKILYMVDVVEEKIKYSIWIVAIESLIVSSIEDEMETGTIHIIRSENNIEEKINNSDIFLTDWGGSYSIKETMSPFYFPLDSSNYILIN